MIASGSSTNPSAALSNQTVNLFFNKVSSA
jgi:hypothetical protein